MLSLLLSGGLSLPALVGKTPHDLETAEGKYEYLSNSCDNSGNG